MDPHRIFILVFGLLFSSVTCFAQDNSKPTTFTIVGLESSVGLSPSVDVLVPLIPNYFKLERPSGVEVVDTIFDGGKMSIEGNFIKLIPNEIDSFRLVVVFESENSGKQVVIEKKLYPLPSPELKLHQTACDSMISRTDLILNGTLKCVPGAYKLEVVDYNVEYANQNSGFLSFSNLADRKQARAFSRTSEDGDVIRYSSVLVQSASGDQVNLGGCVVFVVEDTQPVMQFGGGPVIRK